MWLRIVNIDAILIIFVFCFFNDSIDVYLAIPVNESQIFTIESSEDSVTMDGSWDEGANAQVADDLNIAQMNMPDDEEGEDQNLNL